MKEMSWGQLTHADSVGMPTRTARGGMQPRERLAGGAAGDAGPSTRAATRPAAADPTQPALHAPAARSDTTPNTAAENLSAKGRICRGPAGGSGRMRPQSPRQTPPIRRCPQLAYAVHYGRLAWTAEVYP